MRRGYIGADNANGQPMGSDYKLGSEVSNPLKGQQAVAHYPEFGAQRRDCGEQECGPAFGYMQQFRPASVTTFAAPKCNIPSGGYVAAVSCEYPGSSLKRVRA